MPSAGISKVDGKNLLRALFLGVLLSVVPTSGAAEEPTLSGAVLLQHCEVVLQADAPPSFETGTCKGILETLRYI